MVQSVELLLDPDTERRIRDEWTALADAGLPSLATNRNASNRPHVTLAVAEAGLEPAVHALKAVFRGWHLAADGLPVTIGAVLLFGGHRGRWVVARSVVPSRPLMTVQSAVHRAIGLAAAEVETIENARPDAWTPHVSLARRMPADRMSDAMVRLDAEPIQARFTDARLWDGNTKTVHDLC